MTQNLPSKQNGAAPLVKDNPLGALLAQNKKAIESLLPKHMTPERMLRIAYSAISRNHDLAICTPVSLLNCVISAAQIGLEIGGPLALVHLIPFNNKHTGKKEAQLIIGYQGYRELAYRSGMILSFPAHAVYEKDYFDYAYGLEMRLKHVPCTEKDSGKLTAAWAGAVFKGGGWDFEVIHEREAEAAKAKSAAKFKKDSPWNIAEQVHTMWVKTAVRRLAKRLPMSPDIRQAAMIEEYQEAGVRFDLGLEAPDMPSEPTTDDLNKALDPDFDEVVDGEVADPAPEGENISPATLQSVEKELTRLGVPGHLPPDIVAEYGTGDPSELTEAQGRQALAFLKNMQS